MKRDIQNIQTLLSEMGKNLTELNDRVTRLENLAEATKRVLTAHECYINGLEAKDGNHDFNI